MPASKFAAGFSVYLARTIAIATLLGLAGCQSYTDPSAGRTVGEVTDDASLLVRVKGALLRDRKVSGFRINVEVHQGVVALHGRVGNETQRLRALGIARDVRGVREVRDHLAVGDAPQQPPSD